MANRIMNISKYKELEKMVEAPFSVSGIRSNSNLHGSLKDILRTGIARTGRYSGSGRYTTASTWTDEVTAYLSKMGIAYEAGNDAPRGGATGEYVKVTMPAFLKVTKDIVAKEEAERKALIAAREEEEVRIKNLHNEVREAVAKNPSIKDECQALFNSRIDEYLSGDKRRHNRQKAKNYASRIIAEKYNLDINAVRYILL